MKACRWRPPGGSVRASVMAMQGLLPVMRTALYSCGWERSTEAAEGRTAHEGARRYQCLYRLPGCFTRPHVPSVLAGGTTYVALNKINGVDEALQAPYAAPVMPGHSHLLRENWSHTSLLHKPLPLSHLDIHCFWSDALSHSFIQYQLRHPQAITWRAIWLGFCNCIPS